MASVKEHYDNLLAEHYSWMFGDYDTKVTDNTYFFEENNIIPRLSGKALDLGCGSGFQSIALADLGFKVLGIDLCEALLQELRGRSRGPEIEIVQGNLLDHTLYSNKGPFEVAVCMGDTLTHLSTVEDIIPLFEHVHANLERGGSFVISFRDLTTELQGTDRIVPVRTDEEKLMATFLEYGETHVKVHDMIFVREDSGWVMKKGVYSKLRIGVEQVRAFLGGVGFEVTPPGVKDGLAVVLARK